MKNRLQFNRHYAEFQSREDALTALRARITDPDFIPLIGEPMVFRYKDENDNLQVILAIGKKAGRNLDERDYHVIDTADLDEKIAAEVAAREELDAETIKKVIFDGVESEFNDNVATLSVSANVIPVGEDYENHVIPDNPDGLPHPIHKHYSTEDAIKQLDINFIDFLDKTDAKINGLHIVKVTSGLDANVREAYDFVNEDGLVQPDSDRILIYKDSALYNVYLGHMDDYLADYSEPVVTPGTGDTALCFIYQKADGNYQLVPINVESFLEESEFLDGLVVNNHEVRVKIDPASETFLTVGPDGVKLSGVQIAIDDAQQAEEDRAVAAEEAIRAELDATQVGAGLDTDGSYIHDHPTNYIDEATSLANADHLLDVALKNESDRAIDAEGVLQDNIDAEEARATGVESGLQGQVNQEVSARTNADEALQIGLNNEISARTDADEAIQTELDSTQVGAGLADDGSYIHDHPTNYIDEATSLANADHLLDIALKDESDRAIAAENFISAATANEITRATEAEATLQDNIDAEETRARDAESVLETKISELSGATGSEYSALDGKIDAETQRATNAENTINGKVVELSGATMSFSSATVSEITRIDAAVTRNKVKSTGNTIVVTEAVEGTNLEANIDGKTILSNNGELKTGLKIAALAPGELEANVREAFRLVDNQGTPVDTTIVKIYKSSALVSVELVKDMGTGIDYVRITYIDNSGATQTMDLDIQQLIFEAEFKDGLTVNADGEVRVKIDPTSEAFLSVSSEGVKASGIQNAINAAVTAETTRATAAENSISGNVDTLSGATVSGLQNISAVTDNIISACGLNIGQQGGYVPHSDTHIIAGAGSLDQADVLLDQALWAISGSVLVLSGGAGDVAELEEKLRDLSATTRSFSSNTVAELDALKAAISGNTGILELSAATVELSAVTVEIDYRLSLIESATVESSGVTVLSAATVTLSGNITNLSAATVHISGDVAGLSAATVTLSGNVNDLSGAVMSISAKTNGVLTLSLNNEERGKYSPSASTTIDLEIDGDDISLDGYEMATGSTLEELLVNSGDTVNEAFGKLQKQICDNELVIAAAFNDVNDRITELSGNTGGGSSKREYTTASTVTNLALDKFLTIVNLGSDATLSISQSPSWSMEAGEVIEAHVIINNTGSTGITVTIGTSDSRLKITGEGEVLIDPNGLGEVNALITYNGSAYTIYIITT